MDLPALATFARQPRDALMWPPRALDVARIAAVLRVAGSRVVDVGARSRSEGADVDDDRPQPRVVDVGAGTGLLAALVEREDVRVEAVDPSPPDKRYHDVRTLTADQLAGPYDAAIVSWMEAGKDYRDAVASVAPIVVNVYDVEGGCGVMGAVDLPGFLEAASWRTPSFEDVAFALERPGRGLQRKGYPGNRIDVLARDPTMIGPLRDALLHAKPKTPYPWEAEMDALGL